MNGLVGGLGPLPPKTGPGGEFADCSKLSAEWINSRYPVQNVCQWLSWSCVVNVSSPSHLTQSTQVPSCLWKPSSRHDTHYYYYYDLFASGTSLLQHPFNGLFSRTTWVSLYQKCKTSLYLNEARDDGVWDGSGISWTICKQSAPRSRQITTPTPYHSDFLQAGCSSWRPTNSIKALKANSMEPIAKKWEKRQTKKWNTDMLRSMGKQAMHYVDVHTPSFRTIVHP